MEVLSIFCNLVQFGQFLENWQKFRYHQRNDKFVPSNERTCMKTKIYCFSLVGEERIIVSHFLALEMSMVWSGEINSKCVFRGAVGLVLVLSGT